MESNRNRFFDGWFSLLITKDRPSTMLHNDIDCNLTSNGVSLALKSVSAKVTMKLSYLFRLSAIAFSVFFIFTITSPAESGSSEVSHVSDGELMDFNTENEAVDVMTFNVRYGTARDGRDHWSYRRERVTHLLDSVGADVVGLQEVLDFQLREISEALPQYGIVGVGREDGGREGEHAPILYDREKMRLDSSGTFWFSETPDQPGSTHWGNEDPRICTWARFQPINRPEHFYVYNLHLDHRSRRSRRMSVGLLARVIDKRNHQDPVLVTGDFNAGERSEAVRILLGKEAFSGFFPEEELTETGRLFDTYRASPSKKLWRGTIHFFSGVPFLPKIDHIFASREFSVLSSRIVREEIDGRYPSDHFPVVAKLSFKGSPEWDTHWVHAAVGVAP